MRIIAVGKLKERALAELAGEYAKRLGKYCSLDIVEIPDESVSARESDATAQKRVLEESRRIAGRLKADSYVIALDMRGRALDSGSFAESLRELTLRLPEAVFVIGGSHGLHQELLGRADFILSMSEMTFPHQLARVILLEQLFRAFKIIKIGRAHV